MIANSCDIAHCLFTVSQYNDKDLALAFDISRIILDFNDILPINLNEQAGEINRAAIHYAIENANLPLVNLLISKGADKLLKDMQGLSAKDFLISVGSADLTQHK